jgi:hypothetical protein
MDPKHTHTAPDNLVLNLAQAVGHNVDRVSKLGLRFGELLDITPQSIHLLGGVLAA